MLETILFVYCLLFINTFYLSKLDVSRNNILLNSQNNDTTISSRKKTYEYTTSRKPTGKWYYLSRVLRDWTSVTLKVLVLNLQFKCESLLSKQMSLFDSQLDATRVIINYPWRRDYNKNNNRQYSQLINKSNNSSKVDLDPYYVTGFVDAEGSFIIQIIKSPNYRLGWVVVPLFQITLHSKDMEVLRFIQAFFHGVGNISKVLLQFNIAFNQSRIWVWF